MIKLCLHGELADEFGASFEFEARSAIEVISAMKHQFRGFSAAIRKGAWYLIRELDNGAYALDMDTLMFGLGKSKLHIVPKIEGAGGGSEGQGGLKLVLGVALIGAAFLIPGMQGVGLAAALSTGGTVFGVSTGLTYGALALTGVALALGGVAMMISPGVSKDAGKNESSYIMGDSIGPVQEGDAIPAPFGHVMIGPKPVASQMLVNQMQVGDINYQWTDPDNQLSPKYIGQNSDFRNLYG